MCFCHHAILYVVVICTCVFSIFVKWIIIIRQVVNKSVDLVISPPSTSAFNFTKKQQSETSLPSVPFTQDRWMLILLLLLLFLLRILLSGRVTSIWTKRLKRDGLFFCILHASEKVWLDVYTGRVRQVGGVFRSRTRGGAWIPNRNESPPSTSLWDRLRAAEQHCLSTGVSGWLQSLPLVSRSWEKGK